MGVKINQMGKPTPTVSVQMAVYNGERFLAATIESILAQHFTDFELIIVDDGSTDTTPAMLATYAAQDGRIRLLRNPTQQGISAARNRALALSQGRYVAITDADDLSSPLRLQKQVAFLEEHPAIGLLGTWVNRIDEQGKVIGKHWPAPETTRLQWKLLFTPTVVHSASMMRRALVEQVGGYALDKPCTIDYDLWLRLAPLTQFHTLPEELVAYRVHRYGVSAQRQQEQYAIALQLSQGTLTTLLSKPVTLAETHALRSLVTGQLDRASLAELQLAGALLPALYQAYCQRAKLTAPAQRLIKHEIAGYYRRLADHCRPASRWADRYQRVQAWRFQPRLPAVWGRLRRLGRWLYGR